MLLGRNLPGQFTWMRFYPETHKGTATILTGDMGKSSPLLKLQLVIFIMYGSFSCKYIGKWAQVTWEDSKLNRPKWGTFKIPELVYLITYLEKSWRGRLIFQLYLETSKQDSGKKKKKKTPSKQ